MNKSMLFFILMGFASFQAMEQAEESKSLDQLPNEMLFAICAQIGDKAKSLVEAINNINRLSIVNTKLRAVLNCPLLTKIVARNYIKSNPETAKVEFLRLIYSVQTNNEQSKIINILRLIKIFIDCGIKINITCTAMYPQLMLLKSNKDQEIVIKYIYELHNSKKTTPLIIALESKNYELAELLIENGADVNLMIDEKMLIDSNFAFDQYTISSETVSGSQQRFDNSCLLGLEECDDSDFAFGQEEEAEKIDSGTPLAILLSSLEFVQYSESEQENIIRLVKLLINAGADLDLKKEGSISAREIIKRIEWLNSEINSTETTLRTARKRKYDETKS